MVLWLLIIKACSQTPLAAHHQRLLEILFGAYSTENDRYALLSSWLSHRISSILFPHIINDSIILLLGDVTDILW